MLSMRVLSRSLLLVALVAACSSGASATPTPPPAAGGTPAPGASVGAATTPAVPQATAPGAAPASVTAVAPEEGDPWARNATEYEGMNGKELAFPCPPDGTAAPVWGTDTYTDDSSVCTAGAHAGAITLAGGGYVVIQIEPGQDNYTGSTRNGVTTSDYGSWGGSYVIIKP